LEVPEREPDTKSRTVKDGVGSRVGFGKAISAAFAMDGNFYLLVVEF